MGSEEGPEEVSVIPVEVTVRMLVLDDKEPSEFGVCRMCWESLFVSGSTGVGLAVVLPADVAGLINLWFKLRVLLLCRFTLGELGSVNVTSPKSRKRRREKELVNAT